LRVFHFQNHVTECLKLHGVPFVVSCAAATGIGGRPAAQSADSAKIAAASSALIGGPIGVRS
jgi:hypothetical protein